MNEGTMNLNIFHLSNDAVVKFHRYRTAMVYDRFFEMTRSTPEGQEFEMRLAKAANAQPDNHTVYTIELSKFNKRPNPPCIYVICSDNKIAIGTRIEIRNW